MLESVYWDTWVNQPGYPPLVLNYTNYRAIYAIDIADGYIYNGTDSPYEWQELIKDPSYTNMALYIMIERLIYKAKRIDSALNSEIIKRIDGDYNLTASHDLEIQSRWSTLIIIVEENYDLAKEFVTKTGRLEYLIPVYQALVSKKQN
jgi:leukotriene-A4 hydrolase